jgi:hypothetical protein
MSPRSICDQAGHFPQSELRLHELHWWPGVLIREYTRGNISFQIVWKLMCRRLNAGSRSRRHIFMFP